MLCCTLPVPRVLQRGGGGVRAELLEVGVSEGAVVAGRGLDQEPLPVPGGQRCGGGPIRYEQCGHVTRSPPITAHLCAC